MELRRSAAVSRSPSWISWIYLQHMRENMQPCSFSTWLTSLNMMFSSFIHFHVNNKISFRMVEWYSIVKTCIYIFLIYSSVLGHLGCYHCLGIVNNGAINMRVQVSVLYPDVHSFRYMPMSSITGSYGSSSFSFLRNRHTDFHSGCTNLHSHEECVRVPFSSQHSQQHLLLFVFLIIAILTGVRYNFNVVRDTELY
jgi:hypothetical protein